MKNLLTRALNMLYCIVVLLFFLDGFTGFDINAQAIKTFVYIGLLVGSPVMLVWNFFVIDPILKRVIWTLFPAIMLVFIFITSPMKILFSSGSWHTQSILYQSRHTSSITIEFQMQDIGALGYNERTVEVQYLTPYFMIVKVIPSRAASGSDWIPVEKDVNELGLKYP
jgi:hypothetical protein